VKGEGDVMGEVESADGAVVNLLSVEDYKLGRVVFGLVILNDEPSVVRRGAPRREGGFTDDPL
jgi:hypothetical protein